VFGAFIIYSCCALLAERAHSWTLSATYRSFHIQSDYVLILLMTVIIVGLVLELFLAVCLVTAEAAKPRSVPIVVTPVHHYTHSPTTKALFHPILSPSDTPVPSLTLNAAPTTIYRPRSVEDSQPVQWDPVEVLGPDVEDRHTLSQLARMSGNAYALPGQKNWYDIDSAWNIVSRNCLARPYLVIYAQELSFRLGRSYRRISWACLFVFRQQYCNSFHKGHHTSGADVQEGQVQR
jgi:hypothetical protein